jgi:hypothetical protein
MRARSHPKTFLRSTWILTVGLGLLTGSERVAAQTLVELRKAPAPILRAHTALESRNTRLGQRLSDWVWNPDLENGLEFAAVVDYGLATPDQIEEVESLSQAATDRSAGVLALEFQDIDFADQRADILEGRIASLDPGEQRYRGRDSQRSAVRRDVFVGRPQRSRTVIETRVIEPVRTVEVVEVRYQPTRIPALTPAQASIVRRNAHTLARRWRNEIGVSSTGRLNPYVATTRRSSSSTSRSPRSPRRPASTTGRCARRSTWKDSPTRIWS